MSFIRHKTRKLFILTCSIFAVTFLAINFRFQSIDDNVSKTSNIENSEIKAISQQYMSGHEENLQFKQITNNNTIRNQTANTQQNNSLEIIKNIKNYRGNIKYQLNMFNDAIKSVKYITSVAEPKNFDYTATTNTIEYNIEYDISDRQNEVIPDRIQIVENNNIIAEVPVEKEDNKSTSICVKLQNEDLKWGKDYTIRGLVSEQFKIIDEKNDDNRYYYSSNEELTTLFSNDVNIHAEPKIPEKHTQTITHIFYIPDGTMIYNLDKSKVGLSIEGYFTGCHDSNYPGFIKIEADHFDYLIEDTDNIIEYNNGKILPTGSISQLGNKTPMPYGCGPTCVEILAKWEKGIEFSKDDYSTYKGLHIEQLQNILRQTGKTKSVFTVYDASKDIMAAKANNKVTEITSYENGVKAQEFTSISTNDIKNEIIDQIDKNHRVIACVAFTNKSGNFKDTIIANDCWRGFEDLRVELLVSNYMVYIEPDAEGLYDVPINSILGLEYMYMGSDYLKSHYDPKTNSLRFTESERTALYDKVHSETIAIHNVDINQHFVVITGYRDTQDGLKFYVADPYYSSESSKGYSKYGTSYLYGLIEIDADLLSKSVLNCSDGLSFYTD